MKRNLLLLSGIIFCSFVGVSQNNDQPQSGKIDVKSKIVYSSQSEKSAMIKQYERAIEVRLQRGVSKQELKPLYAKLEGSKNAKIVQDEK